eukprot:CAMPEP_0113595386 /NCGR_PEP_ID=MMETSP0015_2-20120614/39674_1 /TAXON_ID=2838 /ORGANISM="Odontella" /LENGTH=1132 /DNA_ID=CAMNT_0000502629 /DNA_START=33 /DNA_END=3431 /DNA_ORIENTATION=- /assembly_acc=CAM_ASM_000160
MTTRPSRRISRHPAKMALAATFLAAAASRSSGPRCARVAAFSVASFATTTAGRSSRGVASAAASSSSRNSGGRGPLAAFFRRSSNSAACASSSSSSSSITSLHQSSVAVEELEKTMDVTHPAFEVIAKDVVTEYGAYTTLYRHKKSGAELLSVSSDDDNKVFGITFRTPPSDSTGVPHILEHSVLCGSRKYTTKDPFVQLLQGSLQTFLNAFTYPDRTCYVVASQNSKDFYNLVNVYADAVFHPRATSDPMVHAQEGWHLELEDASEPLTYKGVVYNEMKGVYSSPDSLLNRESQRSVFPDNTYGVDSGGDPAVIPELSFEQFADFHAKFYHPANSRIYFSGDDDVATRLELMDEYLNEFDASPESKPGSEVQWQAKTFEEPKWERHPYPAGADQPETHMVQVNWLLNDEPMSPADELTLNILDHLLMGTTSAILRKTVMESGLGAAVTGGGLSDELLQATYSVGLKGVEPANVAAVQELIVETLTKAAEEGFDADDIASSMNTIEFSLREFNTGSFPKGLSFMLGAMSKWLYEESPTGALKFEEPLAELKAKIAEGGSRVFQDMIRELLLNNSHRSTVEMVPSKTLEAEQLEDEARRLAEIKDSLTDEQLQDIVDKTGELKALQGKEDSPEDRATIPSLELSDLKREVTEYPHEVSEDESGSGVTVTRHELVSTSGIAYVNFGVDMSDLPLEDAPLIPLFTRILLETGAGDLSDVQLSRRMGIHTGGISASTLMVPVFEEGQDESAASDGTKMITKLFLRGKSTADKAGELFALYNLILTDANLNSPKKIVEILRETKTRMESSVQSAGHSYANTRLASRYTPSGYIGEKMGGITYLDTVKELLDAAENDWPSVLARLEGIRSALLKQTKCRDGMILDITGDKRVMETIAPEVESFLSNLPGDAAPSEKFQDFYSEDHPWVTQAKSEMSSAAPLVDEGFVVPTQVSYVGKGGKIYEAGEHVSGSTAVVSRFLRTGYLWDNVRVIGGAYGGFCTFSQDSGFFSFLSYRDPNLAGTLDVYDACGEALVAIADDLEKDPDALATAVIGAVGDLDGALSPDQKGWLAFNRWVRGSGPEYRQKFRDEVLNTSAEDFREFGRRLISMKDPTVAVVSSTAAFEAAKEAGKDMKLNQVV